MASVIAPTLSDDRILLRDAAKRVERTEQTLRRLWSKPKKCPFRKSRLRGKITKQYLHFDLKDIEDIQVAIDTQAIDYDFQDATGDWWPGRTAKAKNPHADPRTLANYRNEHYPAIGRVLRARQIPRPPGWKGDDPVWAYHRDDTQAIGPTPPGHAKLQVRPATQPRMLWGKRYLPWELACATFLVCKKTLCLRREKLKAVRVSAKTKGRYDKIWYYPEWRLAQHFRRRDGAEQDEHEPIKKRGPERPTEVEPPHEVIDRAHMHATIRGHQLILEKLDQGLKVEVVNGTANPVPTRVTPEATPQYVKLTQVADLLQVSKRTLQRKVNRVQNPPPDPVKEGGGGEAAEWVWSKLRSWLEKEFARVLPERFPTLVPS